MSLFKMKRGQESKVDSLAKEDGSLIFSLNGANDSTLRLDQSVSGTVQRLGVAVDKAKNADHLTLGTGTADAARNVWFSDSNVRNMAVYNDNFKYNPVKNSLTTNITGSAVSAGTANYTKGGESESNYQLNSIQLHQTIDLSSSTYDQNTWYPVVGSSIPYRGYSRIICYVQLNSGTKPAWSTHNSGFTCNLDVLVKAAGWGTTNAGTIVLDYSWSFCSGIPISYSQMTNASCPVIWMRGGGKYFIRSSEKFDWSIKTSAYTNSQQTVQPQTSCPAISLVRSTIYANLDGTASNSNALGGSSLSQVLASAGGGNAFTGLDTATNNIVKLTRANGETVQKTINNVSNASTANYANSAANASTANNANKLGGLPSSEYALKSQLSGDINALSAKRLPSYQSVSVANSFFYRYGTAGNTSDGGAWTGFPSAILYDKSSTANGFGNALFQKKVGVLHLAAGSSAHDLVFQAGGTNGGIAYVATGRNPAYILDTLNYKDKAYTFNKLTASSTFTATSGVVIDGGSY